METLLNDFSPGLFAMLTVIFLVLMFIMIKFAWKPILNALNEREEGIQTALDAAEKAKEDMQNLNADNERLLNEARTEREAMLKEAREIKNKMIDEAKDDAQQQASKMIAQAQAAIESEKKAAVSELKKQVAELSLDIAEKVVRTELADKNQQLKLVETMLDEKSLN